MEGGVKRAFNAACKLLAVRDRSVFEVRSALEKKGFDQKAVEGAVGALEERKLLDDRKFAARYAESILRNKKAGPRYIAAALVRKGIERNAAEGAANAAAADPQTQEATIRGWIERKNREGRKNDSPEKRKKRIYDFLMRRGFSPDVVMKQIRGMRG